MKKRKQISIALCALAAAFLIAGCGDKKTVSVSGGVSDYGPEQDSVLASDEAEDGAVSEEAEIRNEETASAEESAVVEETVSAEENASDGEMASDQESAALLEEIPAVKGIYVTGPMAGTDNMDNLIALVDETELNALVIDIKNDEGYVVCEMDSPTVSEVGSVKRYVRDMPGLIQKCKEKGIYLIARIVAFKDPLLAEAKPEWSLHLADGSIFRDKSGLAWVNPYEEAVWDYLVEVALEAVEMGFDEIQFDYIRFSTDSGMKDVDFGPAAAERSKEDVVADFTAYACENFMRQEQRCLQMFMAL